MLEDPPLTVSIRPVADLGKFVTGYSRCLSASDYIHHTFKLRLLSRLALKRVQDEKIDDDNEDFEQRLQTP